MRDSCRHVDRLEEGTGGYVVTEEGRVVTFRVHQVDIQVTTRYHQITHR